MIPGHWAPDGGRTQDAPASLVRGEDVPLLRSKPSQRHIPAQISDIIGLLPATPEILRSLAIKGARSSTSNLVLLRVHATLQMSETVDVLSLVYVLGVQPPGHWRLLKHLGRIRLRIEIFKGCSELIEASTRDVGTSPLVVCAPAPSQFPLVLCLSLYDLFPGNLELVLVHEHAFFLVFDAFVMGAAGERGLLDVLARRLV